MKHRKGRKPAEFPDVRKLDDTALVPSKVARLTCGISRTTQYRLEKAGKFPKGRMIGSMKRYVMGEIRAHARQCAEGPA